MGGGDLFNLSRCPQWLGIETIINLAGTLERVVLLEEGGKEAVGPPSWWSRFSALCLPVCQCPLRAANDGRNCVNCPVHTGMRALFSFSIC